MVKGIDKKYVIHSTNAQHVFNKRKNIVRNVPFLIWHVDEQ